MLPTLDFNKSRAAARAVRLKTKGGAAEHASADLVLRESLKVRHEGSLPGILVKGFRV